MTLGIGRDGRLLWRCHAGCGQEEVLEGLRKAGVLLNGDARREEEVPSKPRITATYPYTDEDGVVLYEVLRYHPKDFRQRRPDGAGNWVWNTQGVRRVLFHLPQVLPAEHVVLAEGEKDVLALEGAGFVATTAPGGAGRASGCRPTPRPLPASTSSSSATTTRPAAPTPGMWPASWSARRPPSS
jgi:hypothetical protein